MGDITRNAARAAPGRVAAVCGGASLTFAELEARANQLARVLGAAPSAVASLGVGLHDRVAVWSETEIGVLPLFAASAKLGAVFVPVNALLPAAEAAEVVASAQPVLLVVDEARTADGRVVGDKVGVPVVTLAELAASADLADAAELFVEGLVETDAHVVFFTSGSTGRPKGVVLSHRVSVLRSHPGAQLEPRGPLVCPYPLFHMAAFTQTLQQWQARDRVVVTATDPAAICAAVEEHQATRLNGLPVVWRRVLDHLDGRTLPSLRFADTGTSATPLDLLQAIRAAAPNADVRVFYGSTEAGSVASLDGAELDRKPGSVGVPASYTEARIDPSGELCVRSPLLFDGYFGDEATTAEALVDGWYRTGDLADVDDEGYLTIVGRARDVIRTGGESVTPIEVETVLADHPAVVDVAVVGLPDLQWGEIVCAVVVSATGPGDPLTLDALAAHCEGRLAKFKRPRRLAVVDAIPRTATTNQVQRRLLVEQLGEDDS